MVGYVITYFWVASRPDWVAEYSLAGAVSSISPLGLWWAALPEARWPAHPEAQDRIRDRWAEPWGDRRQELVFIGAGMDRTALTAALDAAQMTDSELASGSPLDDPFPDWRRAA